jgi:hypothetical protein
MACKSAYIAATLNSTAASEFFTQDLEDDQTDKEVGDTKEHRCSVHNVAFTKHTKGKEVWYSHKLDDGTYCNESYVKAEVASQGAVPQNVPPEKVEETNTPTTLKEFGSWLIRHGKKYTPSWACQLLGIKALTEIKDISKACEELKKLAEWDW